MGAPDAGIFARLIAEHVCDGIVLTDADGLIVWTNPAFLRLGGHANTDVLGKPLGEILREARASPACRNTVSRAMEERTSCFVDVMTRPGSGDLSISEIRLGPIFDQDGTLLHFVAVQRDVSSQRAHAQESIDFRAYRRAVAQQAIVSVADVDDRITYVNANFSAITGYQADEIIGKSHRILNSGTHSRRFFLDMWQRLRAGETWHGEICNRTREGDLYWVDTTIVPVHGPDGGIVRYVATRFDVTKRKSIEEELRRAAEIDALTGLANRKRFSYELSQRVMPHGKGGSGQRGLVVMFDLDHFKELNDTMGHPYGDLLLKEIGRRLIARTGPDCIIARLGGDEFAALIPDAAISGDPAEFIRALHRSACEAVSLHDMIYTPSFSVGVTRYPADAQTMEGLMINADVAMYEAKRKGRNRWCFFDPTVRNRLDYRNHLKGVLGDALDNDRFEIALQPFCCLKTGEHRGFEILVRLKHDGRLIPPDHFVPLAEELGLIAQIGRVVMRKAAAALRRMKDLGLDPGRIAVNVAAPEFREPGFVENVQDTLFEHALGADELIIEITETALIGRSTETVAQALRRLQAQGAQIALDDFGTGFSSLSHLKDFNVDKIKIDKSFVQDLENDEADRALVDGLIALAGRLGLKVVAEGVETQAQLDYLRQAGCHYLQGFVHARPLTLDDAVAFLKSAQEAPRTATIIGRGFIDNLT